MDKNVAELLKTFKRVIIPDFGAFLAMGDEKGTITFNEFLKFNDGVFLKHIVEKENMESDQALKEIDAWVKNIQTDLDKGKPVPFEGLGVLKKDDGGKIQLEMTGAAQSEGKMDDVKEGEAKKEDPKPEESEKKDPGKEEPTPEKEPAGAKAELKKSVEKEKEKGGEAEEGQKVKKSTEPIKEEEGEKGVGKVAAKAVEPEKEASGDKSKEPEEKPDETPGTKPGEKEEDVQKKQEKPGPVIAQPIIPKEEEPMELDPEEKRTDDSQSEEPVHDPGAFEKEKALLDRDDDEKKKIRLIGWTLIALIPVLLVIIWFLFIREEPPARMEQLPVQESPAIEQKPTESTPPAEEQPAENQPAETTREEEPPASPQEPVAADQSPAWYVVAGCFEIERNADGMVDRLRSQGYDARKFGTIGSLHMVCFDSFENRREALKLLREVRWDVEPDAWMVRY
jgi:cell division septation protein DedD